MFVPDRTEKEPLYLQIKNDIKDKILGGHYKSGEKLPPEQEFSTLFNVSIGTMRKALLELEREGLIYRRQKWGTFVADTLCPSKYSFDIGVISFTDTGGRLGEAAVPIIEGIESADKGEKFNLHVSRMRGTSILENRNRRLRDAILEKADSGWIIVSPLPLTDIEFLLSRKIPFVVALNDYMNPLVPSVCFEQVLEAYQITKELLSKGYSNMKLVLERVGALDGAVIRSSDMILEGYKRALMEFRIPYDTRRVRLSHHFFGGQEGLKSSIKGLLEDANKESDTVLICGRGLNAQWVRETVEENGFFPGKNISLVFISELLTMSKEDFKEIGKASFKLLNELIKNENFEDINLKVRLKVPYNKEKFKKALARR